MTVGPGQRRAPSPARCATARGGKVPTVTDAQLVLGYLDPDNFAGGRMKLDKQVRYRCDRGSWAHKSE